jgi:hypothetical protein
MRTMNYHNCVSCKKGWINAKTAVKRVDWSEFMLRRYSEPEDWHRVQFSDEIHFGLGSQGKIRIIRKSGQRYCLNCIQEKSESDEKDKKRYHCWAAVGHEFKSGMHFYNVLGNTNDKMSQKLYIDQILKFVVKSWLKSGHDFVLKEDDISDHESGKHNIVRTWKNNHELEHYFNCSSSPDLFFIENCWQSVKQQLYKYPHWDDHTTKGLILKGWSHVSQRFINEKVNSMPDWDRWSMGRAKWRVID